MSELEIKANIDLEASPDSLQKLKQQTQHAAQVSVGAMANGAMRVGGVSGQDAAIIGRMTQTVASSSRAISVLSTGFVKVAGTTGIVVGAVKGAEAAFHSIREAITASSYTIDKAINAENARLAALKIQADYMNRILQTQTSYNATMLESNRISQEADRLQAERNALIRKNAEEEKAFVAKNANTLRQDNDKQVNLLMNRLNGGGLIRDILSNNNRRTTPIVIGGREYQVVRERGALGGIGGYSDRGRIVDNQGNVQRFETREQMRSLVENIVKASNIAVDKVETKRVSAIEQEANINEDANIRGGAQSRARLAIYEMRNASSTQRQAEIDSMQSTDATGYAIRMKQINDEYVARERFNTKYEKLRLAAAKEGREEIETIDQARIQRTLDSELRALAVTAKANENIAKAYNDIAENSFGRNTAGLAAGKEWERNMAAVFKIESQYRKEVEAAKTAEQLSVAETKRKTELTAEQLKNQINLRTVQDEDNLRMQQQSAQRNRSELGITTGSDVVSESAQAISNFRIKIYEGMRVGSMSAMNFQIAGIEKSYALQMSREKALHDQRMQDLKDYENMREQQINLEYERATQSDRQRIAELSKLLADPNLAQSQRAGLQTQLQQAQGNISTAENTRRTAMDEVRTNVRGSVRVEAAFRENMARAEARHREQISYLSAIATNTGKVVTDISASYKETSAQFFSRSNLGTFGMSSSPFSRMLQSPMVLADQRMLGILEMIARNTAPMRNYSNTSYYA